MERIVRFTTLTKTSQHACRLTTLCIAVTDATNSKNNLIDGGDYDKLKVDGG